MRTDAKERAWPVGLTVAFSALLLMAVVLAAVVVVEPRLLVELMPGAPAEGVASGRALQIFGAMLIVVPIAAAVVAHAGGARLLARWLVVLAVLAFLPAVLAFGRGGDRARQATPEDPGIGACVERSGGGTTCPGG